MTVSLQREPLTPALLAELKPLILRNHEATGSKAPLDPNWDLFDQYSKGEAMALVVCRDGERAVGYAAQVCHHHQLYGERWAVCVAIYLEPAYRRHFKALVAMMEWLATEAGAASISYNLPVGMNMIGFSRLGYWAQEIVMSKRLQSSGDG